MVDIKSNNLIQLNNGISIPIIGFGTYCFPPKDRVLQSLPIALDAGYRLIDTAMNYQNEHYIGQILKKTTIPRMDLFLTTKIWKDAMRANAVREALEESMENLQTDYIDLLLIHRPLREFNASTWGVMEDLFREGVVKAIGVSNFGIHQIEELLENSSIFPAVNQIELHTFYYRKELTEYCDQHRIQIESYSPVALGKCLDYQKLTQIAQKYHKNPAQIMIRWNLQHKFVPIPRSLKPEHIRENFDVFNFEIFQEDMNQMDQWNENYSVMKPDPDEY